MIKTLSPLLGTFTGTGQFADGTETRAVFMGEEVLENVCYGFRFSLTSEPEKTLLNSAYIIANETDEGHIRLMYISSNNHEQLALQWVNTQDDKMNFSRILVCFESIATLPLQQRLVFQLNSVDHFQLSFETIDTQHRTHTKLWAANCQRQTSVSTRSVTLTTGRIAV